MARSFVHHKLIYGAAAGAALANSLLLLFITSFAYAKGGKLLITVDSLGWWEFWIADVLSFMLGLVLGVWALILAVKE